jgi:hypothetical protein
MQTRHLDLLLLAGCSCLLTLLAQPIAQAATTPQIQLRTVVQTPTQVQGSFCPIELRQRPKLKD